MSRLRRGWIALTVAVMIGGGVSLITAPLWIPTLTRLLLHEYAIDLQSIEIKQINSQQASFKNVQVNYQQWSLQAADITLNYQWSDLLHAKIQNIHIPQLQVVSIKKITTDETAPTFNINTFLPQHWLPNLPFLSLQIDDLQLQLPTRNLEGSVEFSDQQLSLALQNNNTQLQFATLIQADNQIQLTLHQRQQSVFSIQSQPLTSDKVQGNIKIDVAAAQALLKELQLFKTEFGLDGTALGQWQIPLSSSSQNLKAELRQLSADLQFDGKLKLPSSWPTYGLAQLKLQAQLHITPQQLNGKLDFQDSSQLLQGSAELQQQLQSPLKPQLSSAPPTPLKGSLKVEVQPLVFQENIVFLPKVFPQWPYPIDFSSGKIDIRSDIHWSATDFSAQHQVHTQQLQGFYQRLLFQGVNTELRITQGSNETLQISTPNIQIDSIDNGILVKHLHFAFAANPQQIILNQLQGDLFGGKLLTPRITYDIATHSSAFDLQLQQLQLHNLLTLQQRIEGNGILDGALPVRIRNNAISIENGSLQSRPPGGQIQLTTDANTKKNMTHPDLQLAMNLLENFQFSSLHTQLDYLSAGDLKIQTQFSGNNPQWQQGRAVNFNLTLNENIPALLQTLQLSQNLSEKLEQRIKALYKQP